jgi:hypothetical protein
MKSKHPDVGVWSTFLTNVREESAKSHALRIKLTALSREPKQKPSPPSRRSPSVPHSIRNFESLKRPPSIDSPFQFTTRVPNRDRWPVRNVTRTCQRIFHPEWLEDYPITPRRMDIPCVMGSLHSPSRSSSTHLRS